MRSFPLSQFIISLFALMIFIGSLYAYDGVSHYGAGFMPTILSGLLLCFSVLDGLIHHLNARKQASRLTGEEIRALILIGLSITLFVFLIDTLGFLICAILLLFTLMHIRRPQKQLSSLIFSVISASVINYVFANLLMVALPQGLTG
ncbi:tripartite tricarboxylate transporter TctB family protein [Vibrio mangrovi]|uniref:Tripartite tricarboxylate transporter TctB family protein n=1 Tax=Vibrio mangrovi TaxID=474394 RepID=A0A1Y6IUJ8_9VIBR|nr:tripartite tricarboxylate transporter TctB family protein [Vibrio mangrovi]MDW6003107.1 tripartite tricarboxylate transporter TctB family protein [Vibrio mangrovi]SMS01349.1 Tripartite tricarboxylate transporter TctB family protein [Vibrio mangrovi]